MAGQQAQSPYAAVEDAQQEGEQRHQPQKRPKRYGEEGRPEGAARKHSSDRTRAWEEEVWRLLLPRQATPS